MSRATETISADRLRIRLKARNTPKILGQGAAGGADYRGALALGLRFFYGCSAERALRPNAALEEITKAYSRECHRDASGAWRELVARVCWVSVGQLLKGRYTSAFNNREQMSF